MVTSASPYLTSEEQVALLDAMDSEQSTPSLSQAQRLKKFSQEGRLSEDVIRAILSEEKKPEVGKITLSGDKLRRYFPKSFTPQQMEQTIFRLLEQWQRRRQRDFERWTIRDGPKKQGQSRTDISYTYTKRRKKAYHCPSGSFTTTSISRLR